jgi:predicted trehalose synthase
MSEPVAWIEHHKGGDNLNWEEVNHPYAKATPLYTHPVAEQSSLSELTDEEIYKLADKCRKLANPNVEFARAIIKASRGKK